MADIVERITRKNENLESILPLTISAQYGLIDQNEFFDKRIASKDVSGYYLVRKGEFAYNKSTSSDAPWGTIKRLDRYECGVLSTLYIVFRILDEDKTNSDYLVTYYDTVLWHKGVQAIAAEGARNHGLLNIAPADFFETKVAVPKDIEEQRMIGAYFMRLDHLITLHQKKCFEWKKRDFASVSISWEQRKFGDVGSVAMCKRVFKEQTFDGGEVPFYKIGTFGGEPDAYILRELFDEYKAKYPYPNKGDILISASGSIGRTVEFTGKDEYFQDSNIVWLKHGKDIDNSFLKILYSVIEWSCEGSTIKRLYNDNFLKTEFMLPQIDEQKKIGEYCNNLDHLITLHQRKLELLKRLRNSLVDCCFIGEKCTMSKLILYHGSPNRVIVPKFGFGEDRHDYGRGFYLTENLELAKEWAVCRPDETNGWVHKYELEMEGLNILDFQKYDVLSWLAELMKHRDAADSRRYKMLAQKFIERYGIDICGYDVITGWRANASYFYIAKEFVRDNIDIEILEELLSLGGLGIQFCIKSERAFAQLSEVEQGIMSVDYSEFNERYNERDINARNKMRALVDSDANKVTHVFSTLFER